MQNLKVDIIYHQTQSDFEMEFNLCGCCQMRLLNDKTSDKKGFVKALARDVSRSRVVVACGPLFGNEGIINLVGTAIGNGVSLCDNKTYGINGEQEIYIINGSTPLVTPDGYFGGCIIESGPQTIILLTENKAFRKAIMQNLIHPYIEEISFIPTKSSHLPLSSSKDGELPATSEDTAYITNSDDYEDDFEEDAELLEDVQNEHNIEFVMDGEEDNQEQDLKEPVAEIDSDYNLMLTEVDKESSNDPHYSETYQPSESDKLFLISDSATTENEKPTNKNVSRSLDVAIVILVLLLLLAILALVYFIVLRPITMGVSVRDYIYAIFGLTSNSTLL